ncbi:DNA helicase RecQ [Planctomycetota bacterium]
MMDNIQKSLANYWGYNDFLPLQAEAMQAMSSGRDSIVILPTGGGKSLCFQAPAVTMPGLAVVVSPLISLMKDQVDALNECGVPAGRIDSSLSEIEQGEIFESIYNKTLKLLYVSPERLVTRGFMDMLSSIDLSFIAIDEAHCVSMWGHDFRPEYRKLSMLKEKFSSVTIGAYTATATQQVRDDIAVQLGLEKPKMLIGNFDRPNLVYRVRRRKKILTQICEVMDKHKGDSGIIYCIRRKDVDKICSELSAKGYNVRPYHAGMQPHQRKRNQEDFIREKTDTIVATVAFGMGIDKSNVRYVIHAGMPKSLEHYQQESGRAGRDGLEAQCWLFYSGGDFATWKSILSDMPLEANKIAMTKLSSMYNYCTGGLCRHKAILNYFGQTLEKENCACCDVCLGEIKSIDHALETSQKILSCIVRLDQRFGAGYTSLVLTGSRDSRILQSGHDTLTTYGLLSDYPKSAVHEWTEQLIGQDYIARTGEYNVLSITQKGWKLLKGDAQPRLLKPAQKKTKRSKAVTDSWQGVDKGLFDLLKKLRTKIAKTKHVPAYIVFSDAALRDMARRKPSNPASFIEIKGIGQKKTKQYSATVLKVISDYCQANSIDTDIITTD